MTTNPDDDMIMSFEAALARLEAIVRSLEAGDASLEDSIAIYTEGQKLKAFCESKLASATARIEAIQIGADGAVNAVPFDS
jgi:exodeoxyribonuclease VII small subunit